MKMRKRKKLTKQHKPSGNTISADEINQRILDLRTLIAKRWLEETAKAFVEVANKAKGNIDYPLETP